MKNKTKRKTSLLLCIFTSFVIMMSAFAIDVSAINLGPLSYWDSADDANPGIIGKWNTTPFVTVISVDSGFTCLVPNITNAVATWNTGFGNKLNVCYTSPNSTPSANISTYAEEKATLEGLFGYSYGTTTLGKSWPTSYSSLGTYTYYGTTKTCLQYSEAILTVVYCNTLTSNNNMCKHTCIHELGHCLGWANHIYNPSSNDIMRPTANENTTLSNIDKRNLTQLY